MVVATHGHGGLTRLALGSVATSLLHDSPVPLLVVGPHDTSHTDRANEERDGRSPTRVALGGISEEHIAGQQTRKASYLPAPRGVGSR